MGLDIKIELVYLYW